MSDIAAAERHAAELDIVAPAAQQSGARNVAVDAYRGFVMILNPCFDERGARF
jgi:hypothetical protein